MGRKFSEYTVSEKIEMKSGGFQWWPCDNHNGYWAMSCIGCPECKSKFEHLNSFSFGRATRPDAAVLTQIEFEEDFTEMGDGTLIHNSLLELEVDSLSDELPNDGWDL